MADRRRLLPLLILMCGGCGQTGDLYLPEPSGEVVTRPTQTQPDEPAQAPNSPQTIDSPNAPDNPAPEVTEPEKKKKEEKQPLPPPPPSTRS
jgi:predicted small lipoprotein YifL